MELAQILLLVAGTLLLLGGWLLYRLVITALGAVMGLALGMGAGAVVAGLLEWGAQGSTAAVVAGALIGLAAGIAVFHFMAYLGFFMTGAGLATWGFLALWGLLKAREDFSLDPALVLGIGAPVAALGGGLITLALRKHIVAFLSVIAGTLLILEAIDWWGYGLPGIALIILGLFIQWKMGSLSRPYEDEKRARGAE